MTEEEYKNLNNKLVEILSEKSGYFGHVFTWFQKPEQYQYIGYQLTEDFLPVLKSLTDENRKDFVTIIHYFEIHASSLKKLLENTRETMYDFYSEIAWSHFMTIVMFGMLEFIVSKQPNANLDKKGRLVKKGEEIKKFLDNNLSNDIKDSIVKRYKIDENTKPNNFDEVIDHLWEKVRCGFVHSMGFESKGLEWHPFKGIGTKEDPITFETDVPMQEWLQITWQVILKTYGYNGLLELPKINIKEDKITD